MDLQRIQQVLRTKAVDGWLFFDHHRRDPLAYRILGLAGDLNPTRRWYYLIPASGEPRKLVHQIESGSLDGLPGTKQTYASWADQQSRLGVMLSGFSQVAMQYSPRCLVPYVSMVDAGSVELIRSLNVEVVSSADLVQEFEATLTARQYQTHLEAGEIVDAVRRDAFKLIGERLRNGQSITEWEVQQWILQRFQEANLITDHGPNVSVNGNASNPHYEPSCDRSAHIQRKDLVLIDLWAKLNEPDAVYYDITWTGYCGESVPDQIQNAFRVVKNARRRASDFVSKRVDQGARICGFEVDDVARSYISECGYGEFFFHRTGHSIGTDVHGAGANMDNLESHDERTIIPNTCFSIEPGIYLPDFGIRSEVNMFVGDGFARVTGEEQESLVLV